LTACENGQLLLDHSGDIRATSDVHQFETYKMNQMSDTRIGNALAVRDIQCMKSTQSTDMLQSVVTDALTAADRKMFQRFELDQMN